ncbi:MAG: GntR family transcriptional regulator [Spirochaetaceae bacterium]|nr:GntR family transcriptional regulator [Spirochaetaceae bacterium]MCF7947592.1 GntR family transcriptional regulator [Spirochaetia bacterium]MCF7951460.1 GntR family transcriptional regulator [Spirochaetaceae bacterium]
MSTENAELNDSMVVRQSYADQVHKYLKELILSGELRQGDKVVEDKIAKRFGVSRTPIREALTRLQAAGLVHLQPRSYAEVAKIGGQEARDIAQLRLHLEKLTFRLLCSQEKSGKTEPLIPIAEQARECLMNKNKAGYFEADSLFHLTIAELCGNEQLFLLYKHFASKVQLLRIAQDVTTERLEIYMRQHFDLLDMLENGRCGSIEELLRIHIVHDLVNDGYNV